MWMQSSAARRASGFLPPRFDAVTAIAVTVLAVTVLTVTVLCPGLAEAQDASISQLSEQEQRQVKIAERFLTVLERNPRRGTALDRTYGHHVEFGTLDAFLEKLRQRVEKNPEDGAGWMLLGLFESQRGEDADAIDAFVMAEKTRPDDPLASYYLGQSQLLLGQPEDAVAAFERAIERKPQRTDLLAIFQQLGRVHQRAQRDEEAMAVWTRLEGLFPDDPRVQEQIAVTLVEEGEYALALPRYEKLSQLVKDDYRRTMFQLEAAELKVRGSRKAEGVADLETVLSNLNPESWLHREVRRRIEDVFLRSGDQDGLVTYYEKWIAAHPEDVDAMARVARFLASSARMPEARQWMEKALKLAPSRFALRKAFIGQLVDDQRYADAVQQYELLSEADPGNPDVLRDWGKLVLKDKSQPVEKRRAQARHIWGQIIANRPDDALTAAQVADLYRQANMEEEAIALYEKAITFAPADPQYREYLGEFFHILKRPDEALATWKEIAEGDRHTASNVARLAEVYNSFGYMEASIGQIAEACRLEPKDFALQLQSADYHSRAQKYDEALTYVDNAGGLAANAEERDAVISQQIEVFQAARRLEEESDKLAAQLGEATDVTSDDWHLLARYYEAERRWGSANAAIGEAIALDGKSIPALTTAARIAESSGDLGQAAKLNRNLAEVDRRSRGDHLMNVARLEAQMGRTEEALQAGQDLIVSAPGNTDNYEFYAQLCFQLGKMDEGLNALRKAVRINPTEPSLIMSLGSALSQQFRTDEAIEVYWRAFEKTEEIEEKASLTQKLTELYLQVNQFDKLVGRFERDRREDDQRRDMTICLAQAHHSAGDYGTARMELESLLSQDTRDTNLLQQISKLCESGSDVEAAIEYQRQLAAIAPGHETEFRLAGLLQQAGMADEASEIFVKLTRREEDPVRLIKSIDSLLTQGSYESVLSVVDPLLSEQRDDWELMYRQAVAWVSLENSEEAENVVRRILALNIPYETHGRAAEERYKRAMAKAKSNNLRGIQSGQPQRTSPLSMLGNSAQIRQAVGLDANRGYYGSRGPQKVWAPDVYGVARMAAYAWLLKFEQSRSDKQGEDDASFADELAERAAAEDAPRDDIYDWMFVEQLRSNFDSLFEIAKRLAREGGREEQSYFLQSLMTRNTTAQTVRQRSGNQPPEGEPLTDDEIELMLTCYEELSQNEEKNSQQTAGYSTGQVIYAGNGQVYVNVGGQWIQISSGGLQGSVFLGQILKELDLAGRDAKAQELIDEQLNDAQTAGELSAAIQLLLSREEDEGVLPEQIPALYERWVVAAKEEVNDPPQAATGRRSRTQSSVNDPLLMTTPMIQTWFGKLGPQEEHEQMLAILGPALDIAVEVGKARRAERSTKRRRTPSRAGQSNPWGFQYQYGKEAPYVQVQYPQPNDYATQPQLTVLRTVYEIFNRNDVVEDLETSLRQRVEQSDPDSLLYEQLMLAYVLWWTDQQDDALEMLTEVSGQIPDDPQFRMELALVHQQQGDLDTAMDIVEALAPRDRKLMQQREMIAMSLAERLGEVDRARQAAERLFGLRLDTNEQLGLATAMRRLGLNDMAESVLARVQRRSGNQASSLPLLMAQYQGQGKIELAEQIAHRILRTTQSSLSTMGNSHRNPYRNRQSGNGNREQALRLLQQTGKVKEMVERLEERIVKSPSSPRLYEQLIELYQVTGDRDKLTETLTKAVAARPKAVALQYQLAKHYEQSGKASEACDAYLIVLKLKPQWVADDLYRIRQLFERAERSLELAKAFEEVQLSSLGHPYYLIQIVADLLKNDENIDIAVSLIERIVDAFPSYRNQMVSQIRDNKIWKNDKIYELGKRMVIPTKAEAVATPWFGIDQIRSYSQGGRVETAFHRMQDGIMEAGRLDEFRESIEKASVEHPDWHGGQAMLALIDLKQNRKEQARERLEALVADEDVLKDMPSAACWLVGQELDGYQETQPLALKLFEKGVTGQNANQQLRYSPLVKLIKLYTEVGRKEEARDLLLKNLKFKSPNQSNQDYYQSIRLQNSLWAAEQLQQMDYPLDALVLFQELSVEDSNLSNVVRYMGGSVESIKRKITKGLRESLEAIGESDPDEAVAKLLAAPEKRKPGEPVFDLMLSLPSDDEDEKKRTEMSSRFVTLLQMTANGDVIEQSVQKRLAMLRSEYEDDFSIPVTRALLAAGADRQAAVAALMEALNKRPLDEIAEGRRPNTRQRKQALQVVPVWLVARECLGDEELKESGRVLAERALAAARRQIGNTHAAAVLMEWGQAALEAGDKAEAELRWSQLLDIVTERPTRKKTPADRRTSAVDRSSGQSFSLVFFGEDSTRGKAATRSPGTNRPKTDARATTSPETIPPLTVSQFKMARTIAEQAAINGMPQLSRRAVREMLAGGVPVPDADASSLTLNNRGMRVTPQQAQEAAQETAAMVAESLMTVVGHWTGPDYPPAEVYELLLPVVLPPSRPNEIMLFADSSELNDARVTNAGQVVIEWAAKADKLDDLAAKVTERNESAAMNIPGRVLLANIAMHKGDFDSARTHLEALSGTIMKGAIESSATLACHAALPASAHPQLEEPAFAILATAAKLRAQSAAGGNGESSIGPLSHKISRYLADRGQTEELSAFFEQYLQSRQSNYSRHSGDYGLYLQWQDWARIANEAARVGAIETALDYMGRTADFENDRFSRPNLRMSLAGVVGAMKTSSAEERFETWRDWTLPTEDRRTVRMLIAGVPPNTTPVEFLPEDKRERRFPQTDFLSNIVELLDAAEELGRLNEIREPARLAYEEKFTNAEFLWPLVLIRLGDLPAATTAVGELTSTFKERNGAERKRPRPDLTRDYLVYHACLQSREFAPLYLPHCDKLRDQLEIHTAESLLARFYADLARYRAMEMNAPLQPGDDPGLVYWSPATTDRVPRNALAPWWAVSGHQLVHIGGSGSDSLYFRVPLTGDFEFSADCLEFDWAEADAGYNGVIVNAQHWGARMELEAVGKHETLYLPGALRRSRPGINRAVLKVHDGRMSYWLNNHKAYEEAVHGTSPWLHLNTSHSRQASFRNLKLTGNPVVPEQISLVSGDRMDGWNTQFFKESQPRHRVMAQELTDKSNYSLRRDQENEPIEHDWAATDGMLVGRPDPKADADAQSWAYYHRPLADGETFSYEFEYQPDRAVAHPTLGRVAYLLAPGGVMTHWIADTDWDENVLGIPADNESIPTEHRRGPESLPLNEGEWNSVAVSLKEGVVRISLNEALVYEGPARPLPDTRFGLYRRKQQQLKVRNAVLAGPWREQFDSLNDVDLLAVRKPLDERSSRILGQVVKEGFSPLDADDIAATARKLPDDQAYQFLSEWVLPSATHANTRLYFRHEPFQRAEGITSESAGGAVPVSSGGAVSASADGAERPLDVGPVDCPAVDLINLAARTEKLDELAATVDSISADSAADARGKLAMSALLKIARRDDGQALELLREIDTNLVRGFETSERPHFVAPEMIVSRAASHRPQLALAAVELAQRLIDELRESARADEPKDSEDGDEPKQSERAGDWKAETDALLGYVSRQLAAGGNHPPQASPVPSPQSSLTQWRMVPQVTPHDRSQGRRPSEWRYVRGRVEHIPSLASEMLFFQSPLRGDFEVIAERSLHDDREVAILYGMHAAAPKHDFKAIVVTSGLHARKDVKETFQLPDLGWQAEFRIAVDDGKITTHVAGTQLYQTTMTRPPAPWLVLQASSPGKRSVVRNLRIVGNPEIPDELDLLDTWNAAFWQADSYHGTFSADGSDESALWRMSGDELVGSRVEDRTVTNLESLLLYQRPLLEDGVITFEAYYVPGEFEVHPALGGSAFLLRPDGITRHELTDGEYEWEGRSSDNESALSETAGAVPLKEKDWNLVTLSLKGEQLTISVNDEPVAMHTVTEPDAERFFGLFRYADKTKSRVRNITYRGDWPKTLPPVEEQQLAYPPRGALPIGDAGWTSITRLDFAQPAEEIAASGFRLSDQGISPSQTTEGLRFRIAPDGEAATSPTIPTITFRGPLPGDCEFAVDFEQLQLAAGKEGPEDGLAIEFQFADPKPHSVVMTLIRGSDGEPQFQLSHHHTSPNGDVRDDSTSDPVMHESGRLRLLRLNGTVYGLYAAKGSESFAFVGSAVVGTGPIDEVKLSAVSSAVSSDGQSDEQGTVEFVVTDLTVKSREPAEQLSRPSD